MPINSNKPTRAEIVRRRRSQETKTRRQVTNQAAAVVRPLVSRPRVTGAAGSRRLSRPGGGGRFEFALARPGTLLALPTLPAVRGSWRMVSVSLVLLFAAMLGRLLVDERMYVRELNLGGEALVPGQEIFEQSGLLHQHIFWVNPAEVQQRVAAIAGIASAEVSVQWPNVVTVRVTEKVPVIQWEENGQTWWVNARGERFQARGALAGLLPITVDETRPISETQSVPFAAIQGALQLRELRPNIERLHYDRQQGLSYQDGRNWRGYFGVGADMAQKLAVYETLVDHLMARGIYPTSISVENLHAPYYRR